MAVTRRWATAAVGAVVVVTAAATAGVVHELAASPLEEPAVASFSRDTDGGPAPAILPVDGTTAAPPTPTGCSGGYVTTQDAGAVAPVVRPAP